MNNFSLVSTENDYMSKKRSFAKLRPGLYPSEASVKYLTEDMKEITEGTCLRASYYRVKGYKSERAFDPNLKMKAELGKKAELSVIERVKEMGIYIANAVKFFAPKFIVSGELDIIIKDPVSEELIIEEIKSFYGHYANRQICGAKRPPIPGAPKIDHYLQAITYHNEYKNEIPRARIYYIERGDGHRVEFEIGIDNNGKCWYQQVPGPYWNYFSDKRIYYSFRYQDIEKRFEDLVGYLKRDELPPKDYFNEIPNDQVEYLNSIGYLKKTAYDAWVKKGTPIHDWHCSYCHYRGQCKKDEFSLQK
jgi:CRISPR/Cas system-associated exonuclease Cas4 (RecB family)